MIYFDVLGGALIYFVFAWSITDGFLPFYIGHDHKKRHPDYEKLLMKRMFYLSALICLGLLVAVFLIYLHRHSFYFLLPAACFVFGGIKLRRLLRDEAQMPYPFIDFFLPRRFRREGVLKRWPMLLFDIWTLGWTGLIMTAQAVL